MDKGDVKLGNGVVLSIMDAGIIAHKALLREMEEICRDLGLSINSVSYTHLPPAA